MKPENRDPYIMSPAAENGKKVTSREIGVPYLPMEPNGTEEMIAPHTGNEKLKKVFKIIVVAAIVILFIAMGIATLADPF